MEDQLFRKIHLLTIYWNGKNTLKNSVTYTDSAIQVSVVCSQAVTVWVVSFISRKKVTTSIYYSAHFEWDNIFSTDANQLLNSEMLYLCSTQ